MLFNIKKLNHIMRITRKRLHVILKESIDSVLAGERLNEGKTKRAKVNMNVELRNGGRNAVKMSTEDFRKEMTRAYKMAAMEMSWRANKVGNIVKPSTFVYKCCNDYLDVPKIMSSFHKDVWEGKYEFDSENCDNVGDVKVCSKGVPYIEVNAGGDWETPVRFFVYFDGRQFRGYVPLKGNAINRDTNRAFGNDDESDGKFIMKELSIEKDDEYPYSNHEVEIDSDACLEDFTSRIEVKGTYKAKDYSDVDEKFESYKKSYDDKMAAGKQEIIDMAINEAIMRLKRQI